MAEAQPGRACVDGYPVARELDLEGVEVGTIDVPGACVGHVQVQDEGLVATLERGPHEGRAAGEGLSAGGDRRSVAVAERGAQLESGVVGLLARHVGERDLDRELAREVECGERRGHIPLGRVLGEQPRGGQGRTGEDVGQVDGRAHVEADLPVEPPIGEIVDDVAEGRDVLLLAGVDADHEKVVLAEQKKWRELDGEGRVPAAMLADRSAVEEDRRRVTGGADREGDRPRRPRRGRVDGAAIPTDHLVDRVVKVVEGRLGAGVGETDFRRVAGLAGEERVREGGGELPSVVEVDVLRHGSLLRPGKGDRLVFQVFRRVPSASLSLRECSRRARTTPVLGAASDRGACHLSQVLSADMVSFSRPYMLGCAKPSATIGAR